MRIRHHGRPPARPAFTLIELLVVMSIMVILATLVYFLLPGMLGREKASKGADLVQQWLLTAKQRALRDGLPRGVRFNVDPNTGLVTSLNYIEKPADFSTGYLDTDTSNTGYTGTPAPPGNYTRFKIRGVSGVDWASNAPIQVGDYLYISTGGPVTTWHRIINVNLSSDTPPVPYIDIYASTNNPITSTPTPLSVPIQYQISRAPRLLEGEETLQMPQDVVIDPRQFWSKPNFSSALDVLFNPSGSAYAYIDGTYSSSLDKIFLWVRDIPQNPDTSTFTDPRGTPAGTPPTDPKVIPQEQSLIVVYGKTGLIAAHPVAMNSSNPDLADPNNPYQFAQDGQSSGL